MLLLKHFQLTRNISRYSRLLSHEVKPNISVKPANELEPEVKHEEPKIRFKKLQLNDKLLSNLMLKVKSKKKLEKEQQIIVEGKKLITEAVQSHFKLNYLLFSHLDKINDVLEQMGKSTDHVNFIKVPQQDLRMWSVLSTCPGLIGIFDKPQPALIKKNALPITVIGDNIREPNNLGAMIRLANALPASKVLLPKGCADPWDVKAIRGSSGSIFHMATENSLTWEQIDQDISLSDKALVVLADNNVSKYPPSFVLQYDRLPLDSISDRNIFLIVGGENHGISDEARAIANKRDYIVVNVPIDPSVNSLNTAHALAIILFELRRKLSGTQ